MKSFARAAKAVLRVSAASAALCLLSATGASAQALLYDHLECFKITDDRTYHFKATVDLTAQPGNALGIEVQPGCTVIIKATEFCVPVNKVVVKSDDPNRLPVVGQDLVPGFLCYKLKCPNRADGTPLPVGDQFGVRSVKPTVITRICAPADW